MRAGQIALVPRCAECGRRWLPADPERWCAYHGGDDLDDPAEIVFYCPECAGREFGGDWSSPSTICRIGHRLERPRRGRALQRGVRELIFVLMTLPAAFAISSPQVV